MKDGDNFRIIGSQKVVRDLVYVLVPAEPTPGEVSLVWDDMIARAPADRTHKWSSEALARHHKRLARRKMECHCVGDIRTAATHRGRDNVLRCDLCGLPMRLKTE